MIQPLEQHELIGIMIRAIDAGLPLKELDQCIANGHDPEELIEATVAGCDIYRYYTYRQDESHIIAMCMSVRPWRPPIRLHRSSEASEQLAIELDARLTGDDWEQF